MQTAFEDLEDFAISTKQALLVYSDDEGDKVERVIRVVVLKNKLHDAYLARIADEDRKAADDKRGGPRPRGRPRKEAPEESVVVEPAPKRRGRPPKNPDQETLI